jgi:hypothetical protein
MLPHIPVRKLGKTKALANGGSLGENNCLLAGQAPRIRSRRERAAANHNQGDKKMGAEAAHTSNENKISDGYRERVSIGVGVF